MPALVPQGPYEAKTVAGSATLLVAGEVVTLLFAYVPWLRAHTPDGLQQQLVVLLAWLLSTIAAYQAPHTHRPDLIAPVQPPPAAPPPVA